MRLSELDQKRKKELEEASVPILYLGDYIPYGLRIQKKFKPDAFSKMIYQYMIRGNKEAREELTKRAVRKVRGLAFDLITVPPPGFGKIDGEKKTTAPEFARELAKRLRRPFKETLTRLEGKYRMEASGVSGKTILLFDDLVSSGATLRQCFRALTEAGAKKITPFVLGVTVTKKVKRLEVKEEEVQEGAPFAVYGRVAIKNILEKMNGCIPGHTIYCEPFCGSAEYFYRKPSVAKREILADLDDDIVFLHSFLQKMSEADVNALKEKDWVITEEKWKRIKTELENRQWKGSRDRLYKLKYYLCANKGGFLKHSSWRKSLEGRTLSPWGIFQAARERLNQGKVEIHKTDYRETLTKFDSPNTFFYIDPPFPNAADWYRTGGIDYGELAERVKKLRGKWVVFLNYTKENENLFAGEGIHKRRFVVEQSFLRMLQKAQGSEAPVGRRVQIVFANFPLEKWDIEEAKVQRGIYFPSPHPKMLFDGEKNLVINPREFPMMLEDNILCDLDFAYGVIRFDKPREITLAEFRLLGKVHKISEIEREKWWPDRTSFFAYPIAKFTPYPEPRKVKVPRGGLTFISKVRFLEAAFSEKEIDEGLYDHYLKGLLEKMQTVGPILFIPDFASFSGSSVWTKGKVPNDVDWVLRMKEINPEIGIKLNRLADRLGFPCHLVGATIGANWRYMPTHDLVLLPKREAKFYDVDYPGYKELVYEGEITEQVPRAAKPKERRDAELSKAENTIKPFRFFLQMKPIRVTLEGQRQNIENLTKHLKPASFKVGWLCSKKYDGMSCQIHKADNRVQIFSEDGEDITTKLPRLCEAAKTLCSKDYIILTELEYWKEGKHFPREVAAGTVHRKEPDDSNILANVFSLVYYQKDIHLEPHRERQKILESEFKFPQSTVGVPDVSKRFNLAPEVEANSEEELTKTYEKLRIAPASEGFVIKLANSPYFPDVNCKNNWFKLHENCVCHGIVIERIETKTPGVYNYRYAIDPGEHKTSASGRVEVRDRDFLEVGKSFATSQRLERGDILIIEGETVNYITDEKTDTISVTVWAPRFFAKSDKTQPDTVDELVKRAGKAGILMRKLIRTTGEILYENILEVEFLSPEKYLETMEREGIGRRYLSLKLKENRLKDRLVETGEKNPPTIQEVKRTKLPKYSAVIEHDFRGKSCHKDFRFKTDNAMSGWTLMDEPEGAVTEVVDSIAKGKEITQKVKWKFRPDMPPATHVLVTKKKTHSLSPLGNWERLAGIEVYWPKGKAPATKDNPRVMIRVDKGFAFPTVKKPYFEEFFLDMEKFKGRLVFRLIGVGKKWEKQPPGVEAVWMAWFNMSDQTPYILTRRARTEKGFVPPEGHDYLIPSGLPPEWEKKIPSDLQWWGKGLSAKQKEILLDKAYNFLIEKGDLKGNKIPVKEEIIESPKAGKGILRYHWSRGQLVRRGEVSQWSHWDLVADLGKGYLDEWNLEENPILKPAGVVAYRKACKDKTPKGEPNAKWLDFEGSVPPVGVPLKKVQLGKELYWENGKGKWEYRVEGKQVVSKEMEYRFKPGEDVWVDSRGNLYNAEASLGNPEKVLPAYYTVIDRFTVDPVEDSDTKTVLDFSGKSLKGRWVIQREAPGSTIWVMRKEKQEVKTGFEAENFQPSLNLEKHSDFPITVSLGERKYLLRKTKEGGLLLNAMEE